MTTLGRHPDALAVKLTVGDGAHLVATSENGWAGPVTLHYGPRIGDPVISDVGTVDGEEVSWTLTEEQVEARAEHGWVRLKDNGVTLAAGRVLVWSGGLGSTTTQTIASLTAGPPGPTAVSADADNVATLGTDGLIYVPESVGGGGGDTTVQIGTLTLPESPTNGLSVSVLADSDTVLPEGVTWDSGGEPTITERMLLVFVWSGEDWVGTYGPSIPVAPEPPDVTAPTAGTLGVVPGVNTADLTVTGASDDIALHATPYAYSTDNGSTWSAYQAAATYEATGLTADTEYTFRHKVRDAAGNETLGTAVVDSTDPQPADVTPPTPGTLAASAITSDSFTLTVTGASDDEALHAQPYRFSTDNGATYSAYQTAATFDATGLDPETEYTCIHQVRDAALNVATGSSIAVETAASSLWTPADLASLLAWYDASDTSTITDTTGAVSQWNDKSGGGRHLYQADGGLRPVTGASTRNGLNVMDFSADHLRAGASAFSPESQFTVAVAYREDANVNGARVIGTSNTGEFQVIAKPGLVASTVIQPGTGVAAGTWAYAVITSDSTTVNVRLNGTQVATGSPGSRTFPPQPFIGSGVSTTNPMTGAVAEIVIVQGSISGAELTSLEAYFESKWAL